MSQFRLTRRAGDDLAGIHSSIASHNRTAADKLIREFFDLFHLLAKNPLMGEHRPDLRPDIRVMSYRNYAVFFYPKPTGIEVVTVFHGARDIETIFQQGNL
jgi:toxin ParE1/3/4